MKLNQTVKEIPSNVYYSYNQDKDLIKFIAGSVLHHHNAAGEIEDKKELDLIIEEVTFTIIRDNCLNEELEEVMQQVKNLLLKNITFEDLEEIAYNNSQKFRQLESNINSIKLTPKIKKLLLNNKDEIVNIDILDEIKLNYYYITLKLNLDNKIVIE